MSVFVTNVASMIGIGVAVDYSLFILARYREEIAARRRAASRRGGSRCARPGVAVAFSGITVIVSLAGLLLVDSTTLRSMAIRGDHGRRGLDPRRDDLPAGADGGCSAGAPTSRGRTAGVVAAIVRWLRRVFRRPAARRGRARASGRRWTDRVTRRPRRDRGRRPRPSCSCWRSPRCRWRPATARCASSPTDNETRVGAELAAKQAGHGASAPVEVRREVRRRRRHRSGQPARAEGASPRQREGRSAGGRASRPAVPSARRRRPR